MDLTLTVEQQDLQARAEALGRSDEEGQERGGPRRDPNTDPNSIAFLGEHPCFQL